MRPPLLVTPVDHLDEAGRVKFEENVTEIAGAVDGDTISCPFPIALYHRIDGIWLPVSDLGAFHSAPSGNEPARDIQESTYVPPGHGVCDDDTED